MTCAGAVILSVLPSSSGIWRWGHARDASALVLSMTARNLAKPCRPSNPKW